MEVQTFRQYVKETIYIVSNRFHTGAYMSQKEAKAVYEHGALLTPETYMFVASFDSLGEFLTEEEINTFKEKHANYLKFLESKANEKNTVSVNPRNPKKQ